MERTSFGGHPLFTPLPEQIQFPPAGSISPLDLLPMLSSPSLPSRHRYRGENSPHTQEGDMSTTEDDYNYGFSPPIPVSGFPPTEAHMQEAQEWLAGVGLDEDLVRGFSDRLQQVMDGALAEAGKHVDDINSTSAHVERWEEALRTVRLGIEDSEYASEIESLAQAEAGLVKAVEMANGRIKELVEAADRVDARVVVLKRLTDHVQENPPPPWCPICTTRPVDTAAQPCGHLFCKGCAKRMMAGSGGRRNPRPCT
ncbi:hypothetical protein WJX74_009222 [Apatococcus lobatus]|uniref:RING-type domain-containing protein n=1 Tax=Apatococcus lobatus TaxID=904363 RepID=A0AAW1QZW7_9CHLO